MEPENCSKINTVGSFNGIWPRRYRINTGKYTKKNSKITKDKAVALP
jgi:hypothetical protein